ncbi:MAG: hypothetical protein R2882_07455 [Gemmatimonadales bacterium]
MRSLLGFGFVNSADAQTCFGQAGYQTTKIRVGGSVDVGDGYTGVGGSVSTGKENGLFGSVGLGYISPSFGDGGIAIGGMVGYELEKPIGDRLRLCPFGGITHYSGDAFGAGSADDFALGATVGYPVNPDASGDVKVVLVGSYTGVFERYSVGSPGFGGGHADEWYGAVDAGVGFIIKGNLSLNPGVRVYVRYGGGRDPSLVLRGSYGIGKS